MLSRFTAFIHKRFYQQGVRVTPAVLATTAALAAVVLVLAAL